MPVVGPNKREIISVPLDVILIVIFSGPDVTITNHLRACHRLMQDLFIFGHPAKSLHQRVSV
jgi:hypothetical protein